MARIATAGLAFLRSTADKHRLPIHKHHQNSSAGYRNAPRDAVMSRPGSVFVLQLQQLGLDVTIPFFPFLAAGAMQAVADVEIREKLFAAERAESHHVLRIRKPAGH